MKRLLILLLVAAIFLLSCAPVTIESQARKAKGNQRAVRKRPD